MSIKQWIVLVFWTQLALIIVVKGDCAERWQPSLQ